MKKREKGGGWRVWNSIRHEGALSNILSKIVLGTNRERKRKRDSSKQNRETNGKNDRQVLRAGGNNERETKESKVENTASTHTYK